MVELKASGLVHVVGLRLEASKDMLPGKYFVLTNRFCVGHISWRSEDFHKAEITLATLSFGDITGFQTVVSACLGELCCYLFNARLDMIYNAFDLHM